MRQDSQSVGEEIANSVSHGIGLLAAGSVAPVLILNAARRGSAADIVGVGIFAATIMQLYLISTVYHALPQGRAKEVFRLFDHIAIFLLIAGTYTPFTFGVLRGAGGWTLFGIIWGLAAAGVGIGMGFGMGGQMAGAMGGAFTNMVQQPGINPGFSGGAPQATAPQPPPMPGPPPLPQLNLFVALNGQQSGPFEAPALQQMVMSGQLTRETLVWKQGMASWAAAGTVAELAQVFGAVPPPMPPA